MKYVIYMTDAKTGRKIGFVRRHDDNRKVAIFTSLAAAAHVAKHEACARDARCEVLAHSAA